MAPEAPIPTPSSAAVAPLGRLPVSILSTSPTPAGTALARYERCVEIVVERIGLQRLGQIDRRAVHEGDDLGLRVQAEIGAAFVGSMDVVYRYGGDR